MARRFVAISHEARNVATFDQANIGELDQDQRRIVVINKAHIDVLRARTGHLPGAGVRLRGFRALHNPDQQDGDGLRTGLARVADGLLEFDEHA